MEADRLRPTDWPYDPGRTVLVIGPSCGGPSRVPFVVRSPQAAYRLFDSGPLAEALALGAALAPEFTWVGVRLNGRPGRAEVPDPLSEGAPVLVLETVGGTALYNGLTLDIQSDETGALTLTLPTGVSYPLQRYPTIGSLLTVINREAAAGACPFLATSPWADQPTQALAAVVGSYPVAGGADEAAPSRDDLFLALDRVLTAIDGRPVDAVVLAGLYLDDSQVPEADRIRLYDLVGGPSDHITLVDGWSGDRPAAYQALLAEWCARQAVRGRLVMGILPCRPLANPALLLALAQDYVRLLTAQLAPGGASRLITPDGTDSGRYLTAVAGEGRWQERVCTLEIPYAVAYLRAVSKTATNAALGVPLVWELDGEQRRILAAAGIVTCCTDPRGESRIWQAVTAAPAHSDYHLATNLRRVQIVVGAVQAILDEFVGGDYRALYLTRRIDEAVKRCLDAFRTAGTIAEYTFSVEYIPLERKVQLYLALQPVCGAEALQTIGQVIVG